MEENVRHTTLLSFRKPTKLEVKQVSKSLRKAMLKTIKRGKRAGIILSILGIFFCGSAILSSKDGRYAVFTIGFICFFFAFLHIKDRKKIMNEIQIYSDGDFWVLDGKVSDLKTSSNFVDYNSIRFKTIDEKYESDWFRVRQKRLQLGEPLILVHPPFTNDKKNRPYVFTEFLLSNEGDNLDS